MSLKRSVCLVSGGAVLAAAWVGPLPDAAHASFAAHMTIHMLVTAVAAPLLALALVPWLARGRTPRSALAFPALASLADLIVVWGWHTPVLHRAARGDALAFAIEQGSFLAVALAVWASALACAAGAGRGGALAGAAALLFTTMHMTLLGVLIGLARVPICTLGGGGVEAILADQALGGMIMLGVGGAVYLLGGLALVGRELRLDPRPGGP